MLSAWEATQELIAVWETRFVSSTLSAEVLLMPWPDSRKDSHD
jgi:hypothetical protein